MALNIRSLRCRNLSGVGGRPDLSRTTALTTIRDMRRGHAILDTLNVSATVAMASSRQFDASVEFEFEIDAADRNDRPGRQRSTGKFSLRIGVANRLLNLSLGSNTELLEERAYAGADGVVIHNCSP